MILTLKELVKILRDNVNVQSDESSIVDTAFLKMTDEDLELYIKLGVSRLFPDIPNLNALPNGSEYPIILLSKISLYYKLAVLKADKVDMGADNNNYLKQGQRFNHYMALIEQAQKEFDKWSKENSVGGGGEVTSHNLLLSSRQFSKRYFESQRVPRVSILEGKITNNSIEIGWGIINSNNFEKYVVYVGKEPVFDSFIEGYSYEGKIVKSAVKVKETPNIRDNALRLLGLEKDTVYYIAVVSVERNGVYGVSELSCKTLNDGG